MSKGNSFQRSCRYCGTPRRRKLEKKRRTRLDRRLGRQLRTDKVRLDAWNIS